MGVLFHAGPSGRLADGTVDYPFAERINKKGQRQLAVLRLDFMVFYEIVRRRLTIQINGKVDKSYAFVVEGKKRTRLHIWAWDLLRGSTDPRGPADVIHHGNGDKMDNRSVNLGKMSREVHSAHHRMHRQIFRPHKKERLGDLWRPRHLGPAKQLSEYIGMSREQYEAAQARRTEYGLRPSGPSARDQIRQLEVLLAVQLPRLRQEVDQLDEGRSIPRRKTRRRWREPSTRRLGLKSPRLGLTDAEAAFVRYAIKEGWPRQSSEAVTDAIASQLGEKPSLLATFWKRVAVDEALKAWVEFKAVLPRTRT